MKDRFVRAQQYVRERRYAVEAVDVATLKFNLTNKQRERLLRECRSISQAQSA